ncbi:MAG: hypothetical protein IJP27_01630 [Clostridia bacterium]|nr:hypothetical protein [Clostridia bacterium]
MAKPIKNRDPHRFADRFYDYMMAHRDEILRYAVAALITGLLQYLAERLLGNHSFSNMIPFAGRFILMFLALKYWVYGESGSGAFYTLRQLMLGIMIIVVGTYIINYLQIFAVTILGHIILFHFLFQALMEIFYFCAYQFFIFKEPKND